MKKVILVIFFAAFILSPVFAYDEGPVDGGGDPGQRAEAVPIDGGLSILIASAIGYGAKKAYKARKK